MNHQEMETEVKSVQPEAAAGQEQSSDSPPNEKKEKNVRKEVFGWIRTFAITIGVVLVLLLFIIINAQVPSESMENTIMTSDRLIGFRFAYWFAEPQRGDIILFKYPVDEKLTYIKRVIGLPGEKLTIRDGHIYINDSQEPLQEDYLREEWYWENDGYEFEVPEDCYFVMGDNRNNSEDSRYATIGNISMEDIAGKVWWDATWSNFGLVN
jgi:signal peptidase I